MVELLFMATLLTPAAGPLTLYQSVRHGPFAHPLWAGETVLGFTSTVTLIAMLLGVGLGIVWPGGGNLLPGLLLGAGLVVGVPIGLAWGLQRARARDAGA